MVVPFRSPKTIQLLCYDRQSIFKLHNFGISDFYFVYHIVSIWLSTLKRLMLGDSTAGSIYGQCSASRSLFTKCNLLFVISNSKSLI